MLSHVKPIFNGQVQNFIVQPDALLKCDGRLMELLDHPHIRSHLKLLIVDEAHFIDVWDALMAIVQLSNLHGQSSARLGLGYSQPRACWQCRQPFRKSKYL